MKILVLVTLIVALQAQSNQIVCISQFSNLYLEIYPQIANKTGYDALFEVLNYPAIHTKLIDSLNTCGLSLPQIEFSKEQIMDCQNNGKQLGNQFYSIIDEVINSGFSLNQITKLMEMYIQFENTQQQCMEAAYSFTLNKEHLIDHQNQTDSNKCIKSAMNFTKSMYNQISTINDYSSFVEALHQQHGSGQINASFKKMNFDCELGAPHINFDHQQIEQCHNLTLKVKDQLIPIYEQYMERGFEQNLVFQLMGVMAPGEKMKESCLAAYQSFSVTYGDETNDVPELPSLEQEYCESHCQRSQANCQKTCNSFQFCENMCQQDLKICLSACNKVK